MRPNHWNECRLGEDFKLLNGCFYDSAENEYVSYSQGRLIYVFTGEEEGVTEAWKKKTRELRSI